MNPSVAEYGALGVALIIIYRLADLAKVMYLSKKVSKEDSDGPALSAIAYPESMIMLKEVQKSTAEIVRSMDRGNFTCAWAGRDEVHDLMESIRSLTNEVRLLRNEMVKTRNGNSGK